MVKLQLKVLWFSIESDVLPPGTAIRVWTNAAGIGECQEFSVGRNGVIKGQLQLPENLNPKRGELLCRVRGFLDEQEIAAAREPIKWRGGVVTDPIHLGRLVEGRVSNPLLAVPGLRVEVVGAGEPEARGQSEAVGEDGRFWVKYRPFRGGETHSAIEVRYGYDPARGTALASLIIAKPRVEEEADLLVVAEEAAYPKPDEPPPRRPFVIRGSLAFMSREGLGDTLEIRVLQERLSGPHAIHSETVDVGERYEIAFAAPHGKGALAVEVHLPASYGRRTTLLSVSRSIPRPSNPLELDLLVGDPVATLPLFEATMARIAPYTDGFALNSLDAVQWTKLAAAAGLADADQNRIRHAAALTRELADRVGTADAASYLPVFFVLATGPPTLSLAQLAAESETVQLARLGKAREAGEIGPEPWRFSDGNIAFEVSRADFLALKSGALGEQILFEISGENGQFQAQLAAIGVAAADKRRHVMGLAEEAADMPGLFENSVQNSEMLTAAEKQRVLTAHSTAALANWHAPLVHLLMSPSAKHPLDHPAAIAAYTRDELAKIIQATSIPAGYEQERDPAQAFADAILERCFAQFPTGAFLARLNTEPALPKTVKDAAETLAEHPGFDLFSVPVVQHFQRSPSSGEESQDSGRSADRVVLQAAQYDALQAVQRLARLAPRTSSAAAVLGLTIMGVESAHEIVSMGRLRFMQSANGRMDPKTADSVFAGAAWIGQLTTLTTYVAQQADSLYSLEPLNPFALQSNFTPALAALFGSFDYCACKHCRSVYSPAAYLTDLLHWLELDFVHASTGQPSGYDKLIERRADIAEIELNCENSETLLPHIDLVLETLEYSVNQAPTLDLSGAHNQTGWPTPDLLRDGEHFGATERAAYGPNRLLDAVYPWTLPFNLSLEQSRAYLKAMGVDRAALLAFASGSRPWDADPNAAAETLRLNDLQFDIIAGQHAAAWLAYWNNVDVATKKITDVLRLSGLSYDALLDVLKTEYVRHAGPLPAIFTIVFDPAKPCDLSAASISPPLSKPYAERVHRMTLLQRALGWTYWELDEAIIAVGDQAAAADPLNQVFLIRLGHFEVLRRRTKLLVPELLAWFGDLPAYRGQGASEFYDAAFLSKDGPGRNAALFGLAVAADPVNRALATSRPLGGSQAAALSAQERVQLREALGYGQADFDAVIAWRGLTDLDLGGLTMLYRVQSLAGAANLPIGKLIAFCAFSPTQPVGWMPGDALRLFELLDWFLAQDLAPAGFTYLLAGDGEGDGLALDPDDLDRLKARLYGAGGEFHALLSDPPLAGQQPQNDAGRVDRLFARVLGSIQPPENGALLDAVVRGVTEAPFDPGGFINIVFPDQASDTSLGFDIAAAVSHLDYPWTADVPAPDPMLKSEIEVKAAILRHVAPSTLYRDLWEATLSAYADFLQLPPDKTAFLLDHAHTNVLSPGDVKKTLTPLADLGYDPAFPIAPPFGYDAMVKDLHLVAARLRRLGLSEASLGDLQSYWTDRNPGVAAGAADAAWFDPFRVETVPSSLDALAGEWRNLTEGLALRPVLGVSLAALIQKLSASGQTAGPVARARTAMLAAGSSLARHGPAQIDAALGHLDGLVGLGAADSVAGMIAKAAQMLSDLERWGLAFDQAMRFAAYPVPGVLPSLPEEIRLSMRNRFADEAKWDKAIRKAHDPLRETRRDRLADFLIARHGLESLNDLYAHFLIDVEMSSCMKTSRLVLATNAVQLFIQRIFLGLEPDIQFTDAQKEEWKWRKNYRVWEAARKVFLYPENWLEASLRLDKTAFFEALEEELMQGELSDERIENAYVGYLKKVAEIARLEIAGLCYDTGAAVPGRPYGELHVFGRTRAQPHRYFHRLQKTNGVWTPWSPIEQDMEGDHLIPVIWNRRLHILWPTFIERRNGPADYYELHFNNLSLQSGKWSPKRKLPGRVLSGQYSGVGVFNDLNRKTGTLGALSSPANLTLIETLTRQVLLGYEYIGPTQAGFWSLTGHPMVASLDDLPSVYGSLPWPGRLFLTDRNNWRAVYKTQSDLGAYDFAAASLKRSSYFFQASPDPANPADLRVSIRREFDETWETWHQGYLEAAFEDVLRYSGGDPGATLEPAYTPRAPNDLTWWRKYWSVRPHYTLPDAMKLRNGFDTVGEAGQALPAPGKLYSKISVVLSEQTPRVLFGSTPSDYELAFAQQNEHHLFPAPFFFEDKSHTYFGEQSFYSAPAAGGGQGTQLKAAATEAYRFTNFTVPGVSLYLAELNAKGVDGLLAPAAASPAEAHFGLRRQERLFDGQFQARYQPSGHVHPLYPAETMDFTYGSPASIYFWEIFFHIPMLVAERLRAEGKFEAALKWVSYIFDPTNQDDPLDPKRFWMLAPFYKHQAVGQIQTQMLLLSTASTPQDQALRQALIRQIQAWEQDPFDPHGVASMRTLGYMLWTFMTYVGILIDWGDSLFRQDTRESINEATQLYVFAAELLGRRPEEVEKPDPGAKTYAQLRTRLNAFSNTAVAVENNLAVYDIVPGAGVQSGAVVSSSVQALYFCIPHNPQLLQLWDTVGDRLFKIRHCMNIEGTVRELALFAPPIDPGLLVRARAAGLDISEVLADLAAPRAPYRFSYLLQKASEFAAEVRAFGGALLAAVEKRDAEEMSQLRSQHEIALQNAMRNVRQRQIDEARAQIDALAQSRKTTEVRKAAYESRQPFIDAEKKQIELLDQSQAFSIVQANLSGMASIMHVLDMHIGSPVATIKSIRPGNIVQALANGAGAAASARSLASTKAGFTAGAARRQEEWDLQITLAAEELKQIDKQMVAAEIRAAIAEQELANLELQVEQSKEVLDFVKSKFSNDKLYSWMATRLSGLHYQAYKLAHDLAKKAQAAYALELGRPDDSFVKFGHWDGQRQGLLAGELLGLQLRQLDAAYIENHAREYELRRSVSLRLLDPAALATLMQTGACEFELPEWLFDLDCPGLYMRRIKTLALTLACVTGPYVPVHAKLTLLRHAIRWKADTAEAPDVRFDAVQSIVTSTGLNDGGLFETNLQDARYLPMEGCGVVARFRLELPGVPQFDKTTLADAILTLSYTAREGGDVFRAAVEAAMPAPLPADTAPPLLMSFRHDFADEWRVFLKAGTDAAVESQPPVVAMAPPATIPFDRQPYRARATDGTYAYADRAWALTDAGEGRFELVDVALDDIPLQSGSATPTTPTLYFGAAGLQWTAGTAEPPRKVADLLIIYEKA